MAPASEAIPMAAGGRKSGLRKIPWWGWGIGAGVAAGLAFWLYKKHETDAANAATSSQTATGCSCSDGTVPSPNTAEGTCDDGSTPTCGTASSGDTGYLVGGGSSVITVPGMETTPPATTTTAPTSSSGAALTEGKKYGSGFYTRGDKTPAGYEFIGLAGPNGANAGGYNGVVYIERVLGKESRKGKAAVLLDTPEYKKKDATKTKTTTKKAA